MSRPRRRGLPSGRTVVTLRELARVIAEAYVRSDVDALSDYSNVSCHIDVSCADAPPPAVPTH